MGFESFTSSESSKSEHETLAEKLSQELGLDENGLAWTLRDIAYGETGELDIMIDQYGLKGLLNRPEVLDLAKKGLATAEKEGRESAVNVMKSLFNL